VKLETPNGDEKLFDATLGFESYAALIKAPTLWLGATNDFHGVMDDTYRTGALIPHKNVRYSFTPHMNHRFTPEFAVTRPLWFDQHLRKGFEFPKTPDSTFTLETVDHVPEFTVRPDSVDKVVEVNIYYSLDPDPRSRFWRSPETTRSGGIWKAKLAVLSVDQPLFAFANVTYRMKASESEPHAPPTERFALSSMLHTAAPANLKRAGVKPTDSPEALIDDFRHGWRDWYTLEANNPHHWEYSTRKLSDPKWRGKTGQRLTVQVQAEKPNELVIVLMENYFRSYRGRQKEFAAVVKLAGGQDTQAVSLAPVDFKNSEGETLTTWERIELLSFRAYHGDLGSRSWAGKQPSFRRLEWR
jgi:hypothetical protein